MRKRVCLGSMVLAAAGCAVLVVAVPAHSDPPPTWEDPGPPPHGHLHLNGIVVEDDWPVSIRGCRPLANGEVVPRQAHHENLHTGRAGEAVWQGGNAVVPVLEGHTPWKDCETLMNFFFPPPPEE